MIKTDVIIVGLGVGALSTASELCKHGVKILAITKGLKNTGNSKLAQGGISVVISEEDSFKLHYEDTMEAGCYLNDSDAVMKLVTKAPEVIAQFIDSGMKFDSDEDGKLFLSKEGAHRLSRIIHAGGDRTGYLVVEQLLKNINENVAIVENEMTLELKVKDNKCCGVITKDLYGNIKEYEAKYTIIATGGIGQLYPCTSNDAAITGDGLAMAYRAGCRLKNLEFVQFHPTMLNIGGKTMGLISEAVRGEGGILVDADKMPIMEGIHPLKDLAPRDVVSRQVYFYTSKNREIFLDISKVKNFKERFPAITEICESNGVDLSKNLIPVMPGAHFHMGGIEATVEGITTIEGLFAVGEVACTGVHGANRLASNSLLEGIVFGNLLAEHILKNDRGDLHISAVKSDVKLEKLPEKSELQDKMMKYLGIVRTKEGIKTFIDWAEQFKPDGRDFGYIDLSAVTNEEFEIYNMLTSCWLIAKAAYARDESIGAHYIEN